MSDQTPLINLDIYGYSIGIGAFGEKRADSEAEAKSKFLGSRKHSTLTWG
jgi:hypothetical protein